MNTVRLTTAQALIRFLAAQRTVADGRELPLFAGCWAIFGHGNVAGIGEALYQARETLPTYRAHNEQGMALAAVAYAKAMNRRRMMACTTSIGPGAMNMLTAAGVAHVNRLPVLLLPGDVFANRRPDPVLQQVEDFNDATVGVTDCFRPVSRWWDRITRPEQLLTSLPRAMQVLTDPVECGPVTLALCQDVQAEAFDWPEAFFAPQVRATMRRPGADPDELARVAEMLRRAERPLIVAGGGVLYSEATATLAAFASRHRIPVAESQAGKSSIAWDHPQSVGSIGVTGSSAANTLAREADLILAVGTRLQDFTTGSRALLPSAAKLVQLNITPFDSGKHGAVQLDRRRRAHSGGADRRTRRSRRLGRMAGTQDRPGRRVERHRRSGHGREQRRAADGRAGGWRRQPRGRRRTASWSAPPAGCRASCTSCGGPRSPTATTWNTASRAWATRSPAGSASRWPCPSAKYSSWSATAAT